MLCGGKAHVGMWKTCPISHHEVISGAETATGTLIDSNCQSTSDTRHVRGLPLCHTWQTPLCSPEKSPDNCRVATEFISMWYIKKKTWRN